MKIIRFSFLINQINELWLIGILINFWQNLYVQSNIPSYGSFVCTNSSRQKQW